MHKEAINTPKDIPQTDFGKIYFNTPSDIQKPTSIESLAQTLSYYNKLGTKVTVRNTGHSVNGQTLTDGVQISLEELRGAQFDKERLVVTALAGTPWHEVFKTIEFPKFCTPIFVNNPGQTIHIGGSAAVGGAGFYGVKYGGFWNNIESIKVVTMQGEIIECSRTKNFDVFRYSLGGFGRIGIIAEVTAKVIPSKPNVLIGVMLHHNFKTHLNDLSKAIASNVFEGVLSTPFLDHRGVLGILPVYAMLVLCEFSPETESPHEVAKKIKKGFSHDFTMYVSNKHNIERNTYAIDLSLHCVASSKKGLVYFYPESSRVEQLEKLHPWSDYIVSGDAYESFSQELLKHVRESGLISYMPRQSLFYNGMDLSFVPSYAARMASDVHETMPLTLELPQLKKGDHAFGIGVMPNIPRSELTKATDLTQKLTDLVYEYGGRRYLYGYHNLTKAQVEKHYGRETIQAWQKLKDKLDPQHLLNINVLKHLD